MFKTIVDYKKELDKLINEDLTKSQEEFINTIYNLSINPNETMIIVTNSYFKVWRNYMENLKNYGVISNEKYDLAIDIIELIKERVFKVNYVSQI